MTLSRKTSLEEVIADVVETARELELKVELEDVTESLQSYDKTLTDEELLLEKKKKKRFLKIESTRGEDGVKIAKMTT